MPNREYQRLAKRGRDQNTKKVKTLLYGTCIMVHLRTLINDSVTMKGRTVLIKTEISALY